ncbi:MAG TPA: hemolysin family protein [Candidatus Nocardiopsis merdipullorum]|nr:hemolysin family protein [Candidatus Nocardiopsis merdipullorum]
MISTVLSVAFGALVVFLITLTTGYFVAQEFGYVAVDRSRIRSRATAGDTTAQRILNITNRTSFLLSGAQLGITVTTLLVGYVAEPMIGQGIGELLDTAGVPAGAGLAFGTGVALLFSTVIQMVFGELFAKNLAIARSEPVARRLALSTSIYLKLFGPIIWLFDQAAIRLLELVGITPVEDVQHAATPRDLESIIAESRQSGDLPAELSTLLDRTLDFHERTAGHAMIPRPEVTTVEEGEPVSRVMELMASGHSRFPVLGDGVDDIVGVVCLRDVLALGDRDLSGIHVSEVARATVMVPVSLPLPTVLDQLRERDEQFACVVDEYGGLAGVITTEDLAEELVGEIADEHTPEEESPATLEGKGSYLIPGALHIDEVERLIEHELPEGDYETIGGLVIHELHRLPQVGDSVDLCLPRPAGAPEEEPDMALSMTVNTVQRHVPHTVELRLYEATEEGPQEVRT